MCVMLVARAQVGIRLGAHSATLFGAEGAWRDRNGTAQVHAQRHFALRVLVLLQIRRCREWEGVPRVVSQHVAARNRLRAQGRGAEWEALARSQVCAVVQTELRGTAERHKGGE